MNASCLSCEFTLMTPNTAPNKPRSIACRDRAGSSAAHFSALIHTAWICGVPFSRQVENFIHDFQSTCIIGALGVVDMKSMLHTFPQAAQPLDIRHSVS
jgi:hypothetical protein